MTANESSIPSPSGIAPHPMFSHPTWASARKDMVGASLGSSRLWFTVAEGIVTEVYYPRIDIPQIKDLGFIIADDRGFWVELRRRLDYRVTLPAPGRAGGRDRASPSALRLHAADLPSQRRDVLLMRYRLEGDAVAAALCAVGVAPGRRRRQQPRVGRQFRRPRHAVGGAGAVRAGAGGGRRGRRRRVAAAARSAAPKPATAGRTSTATGA